jgi:predicted RNA-binding protein with PUA-like domain
MNGARDIQLDCEIKPRDCRTRAQVHKKNYWLVKQEPSDYSWSDFVRERGTSWTGVRNYAARNNLRRMSKGDEVLFYHSGEEKAVVGIARVVKTAYPDVTADEDDWSAADLVPVKALARPVSLQRIKAEPRLSNIALVRQSRLSVMPLKAEEFRLIVQMSDLSSCSKRPARRNLGG